MSISRTIIIKPNPGPGWEQLFSHKTSRGLRRGLLSRRRRLLLTGLMPALERKFRNSRFIQFTQTLRHHSVVLLFCGGGQREIEALLLAQLNRDGGILGSVSGGEETGMFPVLHILTIGLKHPRISAGL